MSLWFITINKYVYYKLFASDNFILKFEQDITISHIIKKAYINDLVLIFL